MENNVDYLFAFGMLALYVVSNNIKGNATAQIVFKIVAPVILLIFFISMAIVNKNWAYAAMAAIILVISIAQFMKWRKEGKNNS